MNITFVISSDIDYEILHLLDEIKTRKQNIIRDYNLK